MKDFKTLVKESKKINASKKVAVKNYESLSITEYKKLTKEEENNYIALIKAHDEEVKKVRLYNEILGVKKAVITHNIKCALYEEVAPVIVDILSKYINKPLGEKTEDKIEKEFYERTGHKMYFDRSYTYSDYIKMYTLDERGYSNNGYEISICIVKEDGTVKKLTNENNRIIELTKDNLSCRTNANKYIENINKYVKDYTKAYIKAYNAQRELEKLCNDCKAYNVEGLEHPYYRHNITEKFM